MSEFERKKYQHKVRFFWYIEDDGKKKRRQATIKVMAVDAVGAIKEALEELKIDHVGYGHNPRRRGPEIDDAQVEGVWVKTNGWGGMYWNRV